MKTKKHIKIEIVNKFLGSAILGGGATVVLFYLFFSVFYYFKPDIFIKFMNWFNSSYAGMAGLMLLCILIFAGITLSIFMKKMNMITDIVRDLSLTIKEIADGNLDMQMNVTSEDELGSLASDINKMATKWKISREKEKQWNNERYQMITNLSHDLKTPMMSISGYVDRINRGKYQDKEELEQYCEIIERKTKELNVSINQLFELSKISSTDFLAEKRTLNLKQFLEQVLIAFIPEFEAIKMEYRLCMDPLLEVDADPQLLKRISENLISNTIKYASDGKRFTIFGEEKEKKVEIVFENYGDEIPLEERTSIFEKFYREKKNDKREGNGCGLAIVKQMMLLQDGNVHVESSKEKTDFVLEFPVL